MKQLLGVIIGLAVGAGVVLGLNWLGARYALPDSFIADTPQAATVGGWALGALAGGVAAVRVGEWPVSGWIVALAGIGYALATSLMSPHPLWMQVAAVVAPFLAGVVVSGIARPA
ncbi:hypothetical protein P6144_07895 [Sphingomonas sp. HITSZ_GF]|uniref:hypothetical protein n=1 Tax=Sphingomonas sp. HITSZ_GF TaxID=3037247 RepID=UPI00240E32F7|nr:hypothetical protein [Sphingomonas sp. HITSZ_GF]MDG2533563.1 hypothetical protein [Sphingomonas sp. HITSZ_GF]